MFPFTQSVNPALRSHLESQFAFFNDVTQSLTDSFQSVCQANFKLGQNMFEETLNAGRRMLTSEHATDVLGHLSSGAQPASNHMQAYQRHLSQLVAGSQADLARVAQQHGPETSRTAQGLSEEVTRLAAQESERNLRQKEAFLKNFRDPFQQNDTQSGQGSAPAKTGSPTSSAAPGAGMQAESRAERASFPGNASKETTQSAAQPTGKHSGTRS